MSVLVHCDGPLCEETTPTDAPYLMNYAGDLIFGWSTLNVGDQQFNFHDVGCLTAWGTMQMERRAAQQNRRT